MISCPAAKQIRWVNPSMATVSPSRTSSATASRIVVTFEPPAICLPGRWTAPTSGRLGRLWPRLVRPHRSAERGGSDPGHVQTGLLEDSQAGGHLLAVDHQGRCDPDGGVAGSKDQQAAPEARDLDRVGDLGILELDPDHQADPPDVPEERLPSRQVPGG